MRLVKLLIIVISFALVSGCGYRLAGKADLDPVFESTHVGYKGRGRAMAELLEEQFKANKYELTSAEQATALVEVLYDNTDREILSVDEDGKVREYELILLVGIDVRNAEGKKILNNQKIRLTRDFLFDIDAVLGKSSEERKIYQEMREDVARLILYRMQAVTSEVEETQEEQ